MKTDNIIAEKSFKFAVRIVEIHRHLISDKREFVLARQLLRCGTSIGANVEEATGGHTPREFLSKMGIAYKEARETTYWLRLLKETNSLSETEADSLLIDANELCRILASILVTIRAKLNLSSNPKL